MPSKSVPASLAVLIALASMAAPGMAVAQDQTPPKPPEIAAPAETPAAPAAATPAAPSEPAPMPAPTGPVAPTTAPAAPVAPEPTAPSPAAEPAAPATPASPAPVPEAPAAASPPPAVTTPPAAAPTPVAPPPPAPAPTAPAAPTPPAAAPAPVPPPVVAPAPAPAPKASVPAPEKAMFAARPVLSLTGTGRWEEAEDRLGATFEQLAVAAKKAGVTPTGAPLVQYLESDDVRFSFVAMLPVDKRTKNKLPKGVKAETSPSGPALRFTPSTVGDDLEEIYSRIDDYLVAHDLTLATMVEEYGEDALASPEDRVVVQIWVFVE